MGGVGRRLETAGATGISAFGVGGVGRMGRRIQSEITSDEPFVYYLTACLASFGGAKSSLKADVAIFQLGQDGEGLFVCVAFTCGSSCRGASS